jgi:hypothetical protein
MQMRWPLLDGIGQQHAAASAAPRRPSGGSRRCQAVVQFVGLAHAARGEQPRQQRVHAGLLERTLRGGMLRGTMFIGPAATAQPMPQ